MTEEERKDKGLDPDDAPTVESPPKPPEGGHEQTGGTVVDSEASDVVRERAREAAEED